MDRSLFRYIWRFSKRDQLIIFVVVFAQLPFYFWSLELPKRIVNEAILGEAFRDGATSVTAFDLTLPQFLGGGTLFRGITLDQMGLLFGLSGLFLALVLINGGFKYWINVAKGALGERMLRRLRFDLVSIALRFTPETLKTVKASETATMIKDEVEPIGGFIGDAYVQPVFLGTQALTAMSFIMIQNVWLGLIAASVVGIQFTVIPRLRRILIKLGRKRQLASRKLAGRVSEIVDGLEAVHVHDAARWERAEIADRLHYLFDLRFRIYKWKFMVKFLNNLLSQVTPFLFYAVGGYFALKGQLDIGQLVAVIAAYKDLPPPLKELIDWDQMRLDVQVKYEQVIQQFSPGSLMPVEAEVASTGGPLEANGPLRVEGLHLTDAYGQPVLDGVSFHADLPTTIALIGEGIGPSTAARLIGRRVLGGSGKVEWGEHDLLQLPLSAYGRQIVYAGPDPILFPGSIRDNLIYGLRRTPRPIEVAASPAQRRRRVEALRTGNPDDDPKLDWIDYEGIGATGPADLDERLLDILELVGMRPDLYRFGLSGRIDTTLGEDKFQLFLKARRELQERFSSGELARLVEPFDPKRFTNQSTIAENILFGVPEDGPVSSRRLLEDAAFRSVLDETQLTEALTKVGIAIAREMTDIFKDLPRGHPLYEQFSFIASEDIPEFDAILRRVATKGERKLRDTERTELAALTLDYVEPRHRLGLLNDDLRAKVLDARERFREVARREGGFALFDPDAICVAAAVRDNLLFGKVAHGIADAEGRVMRELTDVIESLDLRDIVERVGLSYEVGPSGRQLSAQQRVRVSLARCVVRHPSLLIIDGALDPLGDTERRRLMQRIRESQQVRSLIAVVPTEDAASDFEVRVKFDGPKAAVSYSNQVRTNETEQREAAAS